MLRLGWRLVYLATLIYVEVVIAVVAVCIVLSLTRLALGAIRS